MFKIKSFAQTKNFQPKQKMNKDKLLIALSFPPQLHKTNVI
jgi:hypothetical protein